MNKIFKVIWNHATQSWVAVSELQKAKGKTASRTDKRVLAGVLAATLAGNAAYAATTIGSNDQNSPNTSQNTATLSVIKDKNNQRSVFIWDSGTQAGTPTSSGRSTLTGIDAVAIGSNLNMTGAPSQTVIIGSSIVANDTHQAVAVGNNIQVSGRGAVAIGGDDIDNPSFTFAGSSQNLKAAMLAKYNNTSEWRTLSASGAGAVVLGSLSVANGDLATVVGAASNATAFGATAVGGLAKSDGSQSFAAGFNSTALGFGDVAIGASANVAAGRGKSVGPQNDISSVAIGYAANATSKMGDVVIGAHASNDFGTATEKLARTQSTIVGSRSYVVGDQTTALGSDSSAVGHSSVALGGDDITKAAASLQTLATNLGKTDISETFRKLAERAEQVTRNPDGSVATFTHPTTGAVIRNGIVAGRMGEFGLDTVREEITGTDPASIRIRNMLNSNTAFDVDNETTAADTQNTKSAYVRTTAVGDVSLAIGSASQSLGTGAMAVGVNALTFADGASAFGVLARARGKNSIAQGTFTEAETESSVAIGAGSLAGKILTAGGKEVGGKSATALGNSTTAFSEDSIAIGTSAKAGLKSDGSGNVSAKNAIAIGKNAKASALDSIAMGTDSNVTGSQSIAIGVGHQVSGDNSGAFGDPNIVSGNNSYAFGNDNTVSSANAFVLGNNVTTTTANSVFLGTGSNFTAAATTDVFTSTTEATGTTAGLNQVSGAKVNGIEYGGFAGSTAEGVVSVGTANNERRIQGVAAGLISAGSTDAINGSQLYAVADKLNKKNYFHTNPSDNEALQGGANNLDVVDGVGSATGGKAIAAGVDAAASGKSAVAMGRGATADSLANIAIGEAAQAVTADKNTGAQDGKKDESDGVNKAIAIGASAKALNAKTIAVGDAANASGKNSSAIGSQANVSGEEATGIGTAVTASGNYSTAIGQRATATERLATAIGSLSKATGEEAVAIGRDALSGGTKTVAIGSNSVASGSQTIAMGSGANSSAVHSVAISTEANATANQAIAIGKSAKSFGASSIAIGDGAKVEAATATNSVAIGQGANATAASATAVGRGAAATGTNAFAGGREAKASQVGSVAMGYNATSSQVNAIAIGTDSSATQANAVALGRSAAATLSGSVALGVNATTSASVAVPSATVNGITYSGFAANTTVEPGYVVSVGKAGAERQIQNVAAGQITATSTDAINGSQLYSAITNGHWKLQANGAQVGDVNFGDKVNFKSTDGSITITPTAEANGVSTLDLQIKRGLGIALNSTGVLSVANTTLAQHPENMRFSTPRGQQNSFVKADDLARHLNNVGFNLSGEAQGGSFEDLTESTGEKQLRNGDVLTMIAGPNMKINQVRQGYEFAVDGVNVTYAGNKATVPTKEDGSVDDSSVATVKSVAEAINHSGFTLKTSAATGGEKLASSGEEVINPADAVEMIAGKNLTVQQGENGKITYATKDDVTFNSVTANNTNTNNLKVNPNGNVDMGSNQITNVASGGNVDDNAANIGDVKTAVETAKEKVIAGTNIVNVVEGKEGERTTFTVNAKGTTASSANEDYVTVKADPTDGNNVTNYKVDLGQKAKDSLAKADTAVQNFKVTVNGADVQTVANGDTVKFVNGTGTTARNTSGQITFDINKSTLTTDAAGNVTNNNKGDTFVTGDDVAKAINEATARTEKTTTVVKGSNTHVKAKEVGNNTEYTVSADKATVSVSGALTKTETPTTDATTGAVTTDYALDLSQTTKNDIKKGVDAKDIVDNKGLTFTGDSGSTNVEKLGSSVAVNGDTNIATSAQGDQITIKLKDDITVNSVTANATTTTNLTVKPNGNVNMGGNKITNVAKGEADTDAVNVSQLNEKLGNSAWNLKVAQDTAAAANVGDGKINGDNTVTFTGKGAVKVSTKTAATETANYGVDIEVETAQISANTTTGKVGTGDNGAETAPNTSALATAGDVINAVNNSFWKVGLGEGATATKKDDVKAGDTVNFANGTGTTVSVETVDNTTTVKYSIDKGTITSNANTGDVSTPDTTNDKVATTKDVVDAIKGSGFKLTASKADGGDEEETETKEEVINPGEKVEVVAGKNLKVKQEASGKITLATKDDVTFNNVTTTNLTSDTIKVPTGTTTADKPITISKDGIDMAGKPITNVTNGLTPYAPGTPKDGLVDLTKPSTVTDNTVATVGDLRNMGWVVSSDKTTGANEGQPNGEAFNKQVRNAGEVKFVGTGAAKVSGAEKDGANVITVHVDPAEAPKTAPIAANSTTGLVGSKNGDVVGGVPNDNTALATAADVVNAVNNTFWKVFANDATDANKKDDVKAGDNLVFAKGDGTTVSVETEGDNTTTVKYSIDKGTIKSDASTGDVSTTDGDNKVATTKDVVDAIKGAGFTLTVEDGKDGSVVNVGDGDKVDLNNTDDNILITKSVANNNVTFNLNNKLTLGDKNGTPITIDGNNRTISGLNTTLQAVPNTPNSATPIAAPTLTDAQKTQAATLGDVLNAGWNVKGNGEQKDFVQAYDSVDFVNGTGTTAVVASTDGKATTVKFDINSTTLTQNADGKAQAGDTNNFATAGNVAEAINKAGLKFSGDVASGTTNTFKRENQDEAKIVGGITDTSKLTDNNIGVVSNGVDTLTVKLAKDINVNSVKATENITIGDGAGSTKLTSTTDGLKVEKADGAAQKITNVEAGTADTDAVNVSQLNDKLAASKWKLQTSQDKGTATDVGEINADDVVVIDGTGAIKVTNTQEAGKTSKVHIAVETAKISTNPDTGKVGTGDNGSTNAPTDTALATAGDVINAVNSVFWKVGQGEGTTAQEKDKVQAGDTVNFANGTGTTVSVETVDNTTTVKYSIDKGTITSNANTGDVSTPDATNDKVATTKDVVDAIKGSGFKLTASKAEGGDEEVTATTEEVINPSDTVEIIAGKNLKVKQEANGKITLSTLDNVNFNNVVVSGNVTAGDTVFNKDGITINNGNTNNKPVTLGKDGLNNGDNKVTGVAKGDVNATSTDAINGSQLHDLIEKGFKVTADNGTADTVKLGETVAYRSASGNIVTTVSDNNINFELANKVTVGDQTNGKPVTIDGTTGTVNGLTNKTWNPNAITSGQAATEDQLKAVSDVANAGWNLTANGQNSSNVASGETVDLNNTDKNIVITKNANEDKVTFNLAKDLTVDSVKAGDTTINNDGLKVGENTVTKAPITVNGNTVTNINDAINQTAEQAFSPLTFAGDSGNNVERKLGEQVNVKGGVTETTKLSDGNIGVVANGKDTLEVKLAKDIKGIDSISVTNGPTINGDGINMNGDKISNLADGVDDKDAVNVSQLKKAQAAATTKVEGDQGVTVTSKENADGSKTYTVAAKTDDKTITVNKDGNLEAVTSELSNNATTGVVNAPANDKSLVTAKSVADAINNSGFVVTASGNTAGTVKDQLIKTGEKVTLDAGKNLTVTQTDGKFSFATKDDVTFTSVTSNTITVPTDTANPTNNPITINKDGISAGNKTISNVAGNLADASTAPVQPDANSLANLDAKKNNAATVGDVLNAGWNLQGNGTAVDTVTHNDTVDFVNGKGTVVTVEKKDGKNIIKVDSPIEFLNTNTNDTSTPSNTAKLTGANPVQLTNVASGLRQDDGTAPTGKDLADAIKNAAGDTLNNAVNVGDLKAATDAAKTEVKGTGLATVAAPTIGDNGQAIYTVDVAKADAPTVTRGSVTVKGGDENKVMVAGDVAKAITDSEKTSSVKAGSNAVTVTEGAEDANGNTEYTVDVATDKTIARDKDGKLMVNTGSSLKVDGTTGKIDVNTDGTTITTDPATGVVKANTTALTNDDKGKVNTPAEPNALATAGDIANAINNSGFTLKTSANGGSKVSGVDEVINPGETIDMAAGKNLTVTQDANGKVTYATAEEVSFTTVNSTTVVVGNPADPNNSTTLTSGNGGLNVGGDKITGVAEGDITPTSKDAVNGSQIFALTGGAKTTIGDVTVTNPDGSTTTYKNVVLDENGNPALVTYNVKTQGEHITNSVITAINNMNTQGIKFFHTNDGKADSTRPSDQRYNTEDSSASGRYSSAVGYQAEASGESSVAMGNNATASGANAIAIGVNSQATGKNTISIGNGNIVTGENSGAFGDPSKIDATNSYSVGNNNEIAAGQTDVFALGNNVKATVSNSVFLGSESGVFDQANASRNTTTGVHIATASSNYTYRGENDANVAGVADAVGVVSVGNATSTRQVQGVAAGVVSATSTDAINGSQLFYTNKAIGDLQGDVYKLGNTVNKMNRNLRAGIAGANAAAGLPQVYIPGKSMVAASAGTYKGEGALAVGYSRASDNGKLILKLQGNTNTRGEVGASVGVGYQW